jgi:hypothetical protein
MVAFRLNRMRDKRWNLDGGLGMVATVFLVCSVLGVAMYSFYEAQYIPDCWPDGRTDLRIPLGLLSLVGLATPASGLGLLILLAIVIGSVPGMIYLPFKMRRHRWRERPNTLSKDEHRNADKLAAEVDRLVHEVILPYQRSDEATSSGLNALLTDARLTAREYLALTGENIERRIDMLVTIQTIAIDNEEGELQA